jgi:hypothetical protein
MIFFVVIFNLSITLVNLYVCLKIDQFRQTLVKLRIQADRWQQTLSLIGCLVPQKIEFTERQILKFKEDYRIVRLRIQRVQQIFLILNFCGKIFPWRFWAKLL